MRSSPRVRCEDCDFAWYGATAAHGLRVIGACARCGGRLDFLAADEPAAPAAAPITERLAGMSPAAVLGTPTSWAR
ncbi:MAG TPA: hypothetical protein VGJ32_01435 [Solirubrobacteraceae bacterium]|jgi:hypothetical protein